MPKFMTIGYGDRVGYERTSKDVRDAAHAHDAELKNGRRGRAGASPQHLGRRSPDAELRLHVVPLPVARFAVIDAADIAEAIQIVSKTPCAVAHGVVEVWPLEQAG